MTERVQQVPTGKAIRRGSRSMSSWVRIGMIGPVVRALPLALAVYVAAMPAAWAYVDPGSGVLLLQAVVAGFLGTVFYFRMAIARLVGRLRKRDVTPEGEPMDLGLRE